MHRKMGIITGMFRLGNLRTAAEKFTYGRRIWSSSHQRLHAFSSLISTPDDRTQSQNPDRRFQNSSCLEKIDAELKRIQITTYQSGLNVEQEKYYSETMVKKDLRRIDQVQGFPCLWVPSYFLINEDTGKIQCHNDIDYENSDDDSGDNSDEEDISEWWYMPGYYHFLNLPHKKLYHLEMNLRTMWRGQYLWPDESKCVGSSKGDDVERREEGCLALIIHGYGKECQLAFCKIGDTKWTPLKGPRSSYQDIAYSSKDRKFYALTKTDHLEAWDLSRPSSPKMTLIKSEMPAFYASESGHLPGEKHADGLKRLQLGCKKYLVDCSGELLMLVRYFNTFESNLPDKYAYKFTDSFVVYKLLLEENRWIRIKRTLGGRSMFVGINDCITVHTADYPDLKEDSIYFNCVDAEITPNSCGAYELGVFNMKHGEIDILYRDVYTKISPPPVWILPQL